MVLASTALFIANFWAANSGVIVTCLFWAFVGFAVMSPVLMADAIYNMKKVGGAYHFRHANHLVHARYKKDAWVFGSFTLCSMLLSLFLV